MTRWFIGIGSNIDPRANVPLILEELVHLADEEVISPIIETEPVAIKTHDSFLNLVVCIRWAGTQAELKAECVAIEERLGRDRSHPESKNRDRTADLDLLFSLDDGETLDVSLLPEEDYLRPQAEALAISLNMMAPGKVTITGISLPMEPRAIGPGTDCLTRNSFKRTGT